MICSPVGLADFVDVLVVGVFLHFFIDRVEDHILAGVCLFSSKPFIYCRLWRMSRVYRTGMCCRECWCMRSIGRLPKDKANIVLLSVAKDDKI